MADAQPTVLTEVPVDASKLREELEAYAIPGFTGTVYAEIGLQVMSDGLILPVIRVTHHEHLHPKPGDIFTTDPTLRKPVQRALERLIPKLVIKPAAHLIEFNFRQGHLNETVKVKG